MPPSSALIVASGSNFQERVLLAVPIAVRATFSALDAGATRVCRTIWLSAGRTVVVADEVEGPGVQEISYAWHGSPDAAWRLADNWAQLYLQPGTALWLSSPSFAITESGLDRLPGSRGQLTLSVHRKASPILWWIFSIGLDRPSIRSDPEGRWFEVAGQRFEVE